MEKITLTKDILDGIRFDDEVLPIGDDREKKTKADRLNYLLWASDDVYIWAGCYKDEQEAEDYREAGYYNLYFNYNPRTKKVYLDRIGHENVPYETVENVEVVGDCLDELISRLEDYCEADLGEPAQQVLDEYNAEIDYETVN